MTTALLLALATSPATPAAPPTELETTWASCSDISKEVPAEAFAWIETDELGPVLEQGLDHPLVRRVLEHPLVRARMARDGFDPEGALTAAQAAVGAPPLELAHALAAGGVGLGLLPGTGNEPRPFAVLQGSGGDEFEDAIETVVDALSALRALTTLDGADLARLGADVTGAWRTPDGKAFFARTGGGSVVVTATLDDLALCTARGARNLRVRAESRALAARSGTSYRTFAWIDLDALEENGDIGDLRAAAQDPGAHFLLGPTLTYLTSSETLTLGLRVDADAVELRVFGRGARPAAGGSTFPVKARADGAEGRVIVSPAPDEVARFVLHRDLGTLLAERTEIFPPRAQPGIAEGLAGIALLVGGTDAADELLAAIEPRITLISESVPFAENARPDVALPAICLMARLDDPEINGARLVSAFQSAVALRNVELAQNGRDGHRLSIALHEGVAVTLAKRLPPAEGDAVDISHNLAPACALVGDTVLIGSHHVLVERLVGRLVRGEVLADRDTMSERAVIDGDSLVRLLEEQRDLFVMQAVLEKGKTQERASLEMDALLEIVRAIDRVEIGTRVDGTPAAGLSAFARIELAPTGPESRR